MHLQLVFNAVVAGAFAVCVYHVCGWCNSLPVWFQGLCTIPYVYFLFDFLHLLYTCRHR